MWVPLSLQLERQEKILDSLRQATEKRTLLLVVGGSVQVCGPSERLLCEQERRKMHISKLGVGNEASEFKDI